MNEVRVSRHPADRYENYYAAPDNEWRRLGAIGKVDNIRLLCGGLPKHSVLEIGAGEGSLLKGLSDSGFGGELYALEISPSALHAIGPRFHARQRRTSQLLFGKDLPQVGPVMRAACDPADHHEPSQANLHLPERPDGRRHLPH